MVPGCYPSYAIDDTRRFNGLGQIGDQVLFPLQCTDLLQVDMLACPRGCNVMRKKSTCRTNYCNRMPQLSMEFQEGSVEAHYWEPDTPVSQHDALVNNENTLKFRSFPEMNLQTRKQANEPV